MAGQFKHMLLSHDQATPPPTKKRHPETLVAAVRSYVIAQLRQSVLQPGTRIDDPEIASSRLSVPLKEARLAYRQLADDGYIKLLRGFGYIARDPWAHDDRVRLPDIAEAIWSSGYEFSADIIAKTSNARRCPPPPMDGIAGPTFHSSLVFYANEYPVQLSRWWVSSRLFIGYRSVALRMTRTLTYLRRTAPHLTARQSIGAVAADAEVASRLQVGAGTPCLLVQTRVEVRGELAAIGEDVSPSSRLRLPDQIVVGDVALASAGS